MNLIDAARASDAQTVRNLLQQGVDSSMWQRALSIAIGNGDIMLVKLLVDHAQSLPREDLDELGRSFCIAYYHLEDAVLNGYTGIVKFLLGNGASKYLLVEESSYSDHPTLLMLASQKGYFEIVKALVETGSDPNITRQGNNSALLSAAGNGYQAIFDYLYPLTTVELQKDALESLPKGLIARKFEDEADPLVCAVSQAVNQDKYDDLQFILAQGVSINGLNDCGCTALFIATLNKSVEAVRILLEDGANPEIGDMESGRTSLMVIGYPWCEESIEICSLLLQYGANVNSTDVEGLTPLMYVVCPLERGNDQKAIKRRCISMLLGNGADVNVQDFKCKKTALMHILSCTPNSRIEKIDQQEVSKMLIDYGADLNTIEGL